MKASALVRLACIACAGMLTASPAHSTASRSKETIKTEEVGKTQNKSTKEKTKKAKGYVSDVNKMILFLWKNSRFRDQPIPRGVMSDNEDGRYNFSYYGKSASSFYTVDSKGRLTTKGTAETSDLTNTSEKFAVAINILCEITQADCAELTKEITSSFQDIVSESIAEHNRDQWREAIEQNSALSALVGEARRLEKSGKLVEAITNYTKALEIDPDNPYNLNSRGVVLSGSGDPKNAIKDFNKALEIAPGDTLILMNRALAWDRLFNYREAIRDLDKLLELNPEDAQALAYRASLYLKVGEIDRAFLDFKRARRLENVEAYYTLYDYIDSLTDTSQKQRLLSMIIRDSPEETPAYFDRGNLHYQKGDYRSAHRDFKQVTLAASKFAPGFMMLGMASHSLGDTKNALLNLDKAVRIKPDYADAINNKGFVYMALGDYKAAILEFTTAIEINPDDSAYYRNRCDTYLLISEYKKSIADCSKAISIDADQPGPYLARGRAQLAIGNPRDAKKDIDRSIENGNETLEVFYWSGITEYQLKDYKKAIRRMHEVLRLNPRADGALVARAQSWLQLKKPDYALEDLRQAIKVNPQSHYAYANEGYILKQLNRFEDSILSYDKAIKIAPRHADSYTGRGASKYELNQTGTKRDCLPRQ